MSKYFEANAGCTKPTELKKTVWIEKRFFCEKQVVSQMFSIANLS